MDKKATYSKKIHPKNAQELSKWVLNEPYRLLRLDKHTSNAQKFTICMEIIGFWLLRFWVIWISLVLVISILNLPSTYPYLFNDFFTSTWESETSVTEKTQLILKQNSGYLLLRLALVIISILMVVIVFGLSIVLPIGFGVGLTLGFLYLEPSILVFSLIFGVTLGQICGLILSWRDGVLMGLFFGVSFSLNLMSTSSLVNFIPYFILCYFIFFFQLHKLPLRLLQSFVFRGLNNSPYVKDALIYFPLILHNNSLIIRAKNNPSGGAKFVNFLLKERPLQQRLAYKMWHSTNSGVLKNALLYHYIEIDSPKVKITQDKILTPSTEWCDSIRQLKNSYISFHEEISGNQRLINLNKTINHLSTFEKINLTEKSQWKVFYFDSINHLREEALSKLSIIQKQIAPITENPYQFGNPLIPGIDNNIFLDREDLKDEIISIIRQGKTMPLLLLRGQRRVGKTSLLKFLPDLLGPGFKVIFMDLQGSDSSLNIPTWINAIRKNVNKHFNFEEIENKWPSENWLTGWNELSQHLTYLAKEKGIKILLCFDEYEALQESGFKEDPEQANRLLATMRSYSQHQTDVIFLFTGAAYFDEITEPDWSKYFVNVKPMEVKYLSFEKTLQLIKHPTPDFPIQYDSGVAEYIYDQTQGHPALTQEICYHIVDLANQHNKNQITLEDLNWVIEEKVVIENNSPMRRFWAGFCYTEVLKDTVRKVIKKEPLTDKFAVKRLLRHGFLIKDEDGYRLCAPLFEQYVRLVDDDFFEI